MIFQIKIIYKLLNNIKINELLTRIKNDIITANNNNLNYII
jgi:hypothetical protein